MKVTSAYFLGWLSGLKELRHVMIEDIVGPYGKYVLYFSYFLKDLIYF